MLILEMLFWAVFNYIFYFLNKKEERVFLTTLSLFCAHLCSCTALLLLLLLMFGN
jgi:hypothetical protein